MLGEPKQAVICEQEGGCEQAAGWTRFAEAADAGRKYARDPEARVRRRLAAAVGWSREPRELHVLEQLLGDVDSGVANQACASVEAARRGRRHGAALR